MNQDLPPLLDCPHCGGKADFRAAALRFNDGLVVPVTPWVACLSCGCRTDSAESRGGEWEAEFHAGAGRVAAAWNARFAGGGVLCEVSLPAS